MPAPAVLFDIDGTLTDTNYLHAIAWRRAFVEAGQDVATSRIHRMIGAAGDVLLRELLGPDASDDLRQTVKDGWRRHFDALKPEVRAFPGAAELLRAVDRKGVRVVLATSSEPDDVEALQKAIDADDVVHAVTDAGDVKEAKPSPDVFRTALESAGATSDTAIVVGDSTWDVEAAGKAGLEAVTLRCGGFSQPELETAGAIAVYEDPAELLAALDRSPLARLWRAT